MEPIQNDEIRRAVRDSYGKIARGASGQVSQAASSCCAPPETLPDACGCGEAPFGPDQLSTKMGYSKEDLVGVVEGANLGLGCGNPVAVASIKENETVVDLGSGGGFDCFLAAKQVGAKGRVIGVDMTPDMITKARQNSWKMQTPNVEFRLGEIEHLPLADGVADLIMSNCVINLSPDKPGVYSEAFRVLKPGGRLAVSDVLATAELPRDIRENLALVSACVGGAATIDATREMLERAGFVDVHITPKDSSRELISQWAPGLSAGDYVVSAYIEAVKPV